MIYVHGIKLPKDGERPFWLVIHSDGTVEYDENKGLGWQMTTAVPVPPHGRLGDLDAVIEKLKRLREYHSDDSRSAVFIAHGITQCIEVLTGKEAPTIIPAEEGET